MITENPTIRRVIVLFSAVLLLSTGCSPFIKNSQDPFNVSPEEQEAEELLDELIDASSSLDEDPDEKEAPPAEDADEEEPAAAAEPFSFEKEYGEKFKAVDEALDMILLGRSDEERQKVIINQEPSGDFIFGKSSITPGGFYPSADIIASGYFTLRIPNDGGEPPIDLRIPCGMTGDPEVGVVCTDGAVGADGEVYFVMFMVMDESIHQYDSYESYAFVFDSDLDPLNNFVSLPEFDYDFFQNTDVWYICSYTPVEGWSFTAVRADGSSVDSRARAFIYKNMFIALIPQDELGADGFSYRGVAEVHDGTYQPDFYAGNVTGGDPTLAPELFHDSPELHGYRDVFATYWIDGGYELCGWTQGCEIEYPAGETSQEFTQIRCQCTTCGTRGDDQDCYCELFAILKPGWSKEPDLPNEYVWYHAAGDGEWFERDPRYYYTCACARMDD